MLEAFKFPAEVTHKNRHPEVMKEIEKLFKEKKEVTVNDIGYGAKDSQLTFDEEKDPHFRGARQPWEIIDSLEKSGKNVRYHGYNFYPDKAKKTQKETTEEYKGKAKFAGMDIVSSTPAQKSDLTVCLKTLMYVDKEKKEFALRNLRDSTKKGGYLVTDELIENPKKKGLKIKKKIKGRLDAYLYKKVK